ncbi:MAG TPA: phospholipase C, phosphocholine-specific [Pirellulales bacterium]|jgi:phospholipase C|nr:phospholipase C, phosphocholine-specific [Pirellulales bacterium]
MQTRREFLKNAALFSGSMALWGALDGPIRKALAIDPEPGSTFLDAEHIVLLMQENRSFDHCFGTLQGVRGYNDPRAITLANNNPVWVQTSAAGKSYVPFRLNINDTKATWMGFLPHNWASQVDARNHGQYDKWLEAKRSGHKEYADIPLTLGYYNRQDIPFYYSLADAFTVCDQHFCSSITPTLPNRLYYWTGSVRQQQTPESAACVRNEQIMDELLVGWKTFPERLEDLGISWRIYQNELTVPTGLTKEEEPWLGSFGCNVMEYFQQYHVRANPRHRAYFLKIQPELPRKIAALKQQLSDEKISAAETTRLKKELEDLTKELKQVELERAHWDEEEFDKLPPRAKSLYEKAFTTNSGDPAYRQLSELTYSADGAHRHVQVPKGDVLHQFREDVANGKLPTVTWLVAPERLSDHPESAWYGAWYISESLKILTDNPEVWKKTVFILTYDENDGYYDHQPPFVCPNPLKPETGFASKGVDTSLDYVQLAADEKLQGKVRGPARESPIGLGYRVPMVIASPWNRGGCVCSQLFDNTSVLMFLEKFLTHKIGQSVVETNISSWRRTVCGDLTSAFQPSPKEGESNPAYFARDPFVEHIYQAQFKPLPAGYHTLSEAEIDQIRKDPPGSPLMHHQETGIRPSCPLPYDLRVNGSLNSDATAFRIQFAVKKERLGERAVGCPFIVYARTHHNEMSIRNYAVSAGDTLEDVWLLRDFEGGNYHLQVYGPNGFFREFMGSAEDPALEILPEYSTASSSDQTLSGNIELQVVNHDKQREFEIQILDRSYKASDRTHTVPAGGKSAIVIDTQNSHHWYDFEVRVAKVGGYHRRFAGRVETGQWGFSDPAMGRVLG